jgi:hypothetical protein
MYLFGVLQNKHRQVFDRQSPEWPSLMIEHGRIYSHKIMRIRYTTYDVRRAEDVIHVASDQSNVMVINPNFDPKSCEQHPFRYARVLGIYHARPYLPGVTTDGTRPCRIDLLWVHWYDVVDHGRSYELDRLQLHPIDSPNAFGFMDPSEVIRAVHLLPQFSKGVVNNPCPRWHKGTVWRFYYVNRYAFEVQH